MWNCPYSADLFPEFAENLNDIMLSELAYSLGATIIGGSIPERNASSGRLYNTCCVFGSNGELKAKHRKIHLFDMGKPLEEMFTLRNETVFQQERSLPSLKQVGNSLWHDLLCLNIVSVCGEIRESNFLLSSHFRRTPRDPECAKL
uniref:Omega-amidase,chloroplastic-like n=1 Tax=Nicotiana sylvestris TaxID=4096 RepID=A0A1U7XN04_NICSY|nr:PREDICTED: omega-amidase,chloroplastic-like [Nicotiana sylvestris]